LASVAAQVILAMTTFAFVMACSRPEIQPADLRIFAASSLTDALSEALSLFEGDHPSVRVVSQFGSSSDLARQILAGAPSDLFFSADTLQMGRLAREAALEDGSVRNVLSNLLVIVEPREAPRRVVTPEDLLGVGRVALADPEAVPAGVYARRYLESRDLWSAFRGKIVPTLDVRGALAAVASGNIEAGIVYRSDAAIEPRVRIAYTVARSEGPRIVYALAIVAGRGNEPCRALFEFLLSKDALAVFESFGFVSLAEHP
jgi:molybdate transport system substrate-binding protein